MTSTPARGPLSGIRVIDFCWVWAGPLMTAVLADLGAEVIKVESRGRLDNTRLGRPVIYQDIAAGDAGMAPELQPLNHGLNRNKRSVTVDLRTDRGRELLLQLAGISDVVCDNFRAGVMDRHGLGRKALHAIRPELVIFSLSGAGQWGPWNDIATYAPTVCSLAGLNTLIGYPGEAPLGRMQPPYGDTNAGLYGALAIMYAILRRRQTGRGAFIDLSQWESALSGMVEALLDYQMVGSVPSSIGNASPDLCPHNNYRCLGGDSWMSIAVGTQTEWRALCVGLGHPELADDRRFADGYLRWSNREALDAEIEALTSLRHAEELEQDLRVRGVAAARVLDIAGQFADPQLQSRGVYVEVEHPIVGAELIYGNPWRLSKTPAVVRKAAPVLGEGNDYVLKELLGLSDEEVGRLVEEKVIY